MNLKNLNLVELNVQEVQEVNGRNWKFWVFKCNITSAFDGIPNNTTSDCTLFGLKLW